MYTRFRRMLSYIILAVFMLGIVRVLLQSSEVPGLLKEVGLQAVTFGIVFLVLWAVGVGFRWLMARKIARTGGNGGDKR